MNVWLLIGAGMVGFAAAWLAFELWRAWTPDAIGAHAAADSELAREVEQLRRQVAELQLELDALRRGARASTSSTRSTAPIAPPVPMEAFESSPRPREVYDSRARQRVREQPQW